jgi:hypothetical protein
MSRPFPDPPRCPNHPEIILKILASDEVAVRLILAGKKLDTICLYGCRSAVKLPSPF